MVNRIRPITYRHSMRVEENELAIGGDMVVGVVNAFGANESYLGQAQYDVIDTRLYTRMSGGSLSGLLPDVWWSIKFIHLRIIGVFENFRRMGVGTGMIRFILNSHQNAHFAIATIGETVELEEKGNLPSFLMLRGLGFSFPSDIPEPVTFIMPKGKTIKTLDFNMEYDLAKYGIGLGAVLEELAVKT